MEKGKGELGDKKHSDCDTTDSDSEDGEAKAFHEEDLVIISSDKPINMLEWGEHIEENWDRLMKNTRLLVLAGIHGKEDGGLGGNEVKGKENFVEDSELQVGRLTKKFSEDVEEKNIKLEVRDVGRHRNRHQLDEDKFVAAVKEFQPTMILLAFCWSHKSELNDLLRAAGIYSTLILREDLALITESRRVHVDKDQRNLIEKIAQEDVGNVFLWGSSGSGKTLMLCEALKMKVSQLRRQGKLDIRVIVSMMYGYDLLKKDLTKRFSSDFATETFINLDDLAKELGIRIDLQNPQSMIQTFLSYLSAQRPLPSSSHTIFLVDEVDPRSYEEKDAGKANWSSLQATDGVDFIIALSTFSGSKALLKVTPPTDKRILCQRLTTPHRNCAQISNFLKFFVQHIGGIYLSGTEDDKLAEHLPKGRLPIWVERSREVTDVQILEFIYENYVAEDSLSVTVLYSDDPSSEAGEWCSAHGWKYLEGKHIIGSEDQCVVLLDSALVPELISRGRNLLVTVTKRGKDK